MKAKISEFLTYLENLVGGPYLWGGNGECLYDIIRKFARTKGQSESSTENMIKFLEKMGVPNVSFFDCSGIAVTFLMLNGLLRNDTTAAGLYKLCKPVKASEVVPGDWCFLKSGNGKIVHIGYVVEDGYAIHAYNQSRGVIKDRLSAHNWIYARPDRFFDFEVAPVQPVDISKLKPGDIVTLTEAKKGYNTAADAVKAGRSSSITYPAGEYFVYRVYGGAVNVTRKKGVAGAWVIL